MTIIAPVTPDIRQRLAMIALKGRLGFSIRSGRTDAFALQAARGWAGINFRTTKQALAWVLEQLPPAE